MMESISQFLLSVKLIIFFILIFGILVGIKGAKKKLMFVLISLTFFPILGKVVFGILKDVYMGMDENIKLLVLFLFPLILIFILLRIFGKGISEAVIGHFVYAIIRNILLFPFRLLSLPFRLLRRRR